MIYTHIHIYLVFSSVVKIFSKDQVSQTLGIHTNFSTMTTDHLTMLFLKPSIYIAHGVPGSVVSSIPASFPFVLLLVYTLHPRFSTPLCILRTRIKAPYTRTHTSTRIHMSSLAELAHIYPPVFPVTVLISLIENTNTAFTCIIDISSLPSTVTLKFHHFHGNRVKQAWLEKRKKGKGREQKKKKGKGREKKKKKKEKEEKEMGRN